MLNVIGNLFDIYGYEKINLGNGKLFSKPNNSMQKDFWIVIEENDLNSIVSRQVDILHECKTKQSSNELDKNASLLVIWNTGGELDLLEMKKQIMPIEENPYYFKKHILYFSPSELESLKDEIENIEINEFFISHITNEETFKQYKNNPLQGSWRELFYRIIIKLPFIKVDIDTSSDIESLQQSIISKLSLNNDHTLHDLNNQVFEQYENLTLDEIVDKDVSEFIDDLFDAAEGNLNGN